MLQNRVINVAALLTSYRKLRVITVRVKIRVMGRTVLRLVRARVRWTKCKPLTNCLKVLYVICISKKY